MYRVYTVQHIERRLYAYFIAQHTSTHIFVIKCVKSFYFTVFIRILCISCHWEGNIYCWEYSLANLPLRFRYIVPPPPPLLWVFLPTHPTHTHTQIDKIYQDLVVVMNWKDALNTVRLRAMIYECDFFPSVYHFRRGTFFPVAVVVVVPLNFHTLIT